MSKCYKDYCREALERDQKIYGHLFDLDGSKKKPPKFSAKRKKINDIPRKVLRSLPKDAVIKEPKPDLEVIGMEIKIKGRTQNLTTLKIPDKCSRKEYKRIWMYNKRISKRIKKLKEQYGDAVTL